MSRIVITLIAAVLRWPAVPVATPVLSLPACQPLRRRSPRRRYLSLTGASGGLQLLLFTKEASPGRFVYANTSDHADADEADNGRRWRVGLVIHRLLHRRG